jgi:uncharacterized protein
MAIAARNLERMKSFYALWNETKAKGESIDVLSGLLADRVHVASMDDSQPGLSFASERTAPRSEALLYFTGITEQWEMVHFTAEHVFGEGDRIAMFGRCAWRNKATGKVAECRIANYFRFDGDRIVEFIDVFDSARDAAAATP